MGSARRVIYYVDGFAGSGSYGRPDGGIDHGSPVLIAAFADSLRAAASTFEVRCLNVEATRKRYRDLVAATAGFHSVEKNYSEPFADALPDILKRIGDAPAFFFIDPFGTKDIPFDALRPIFGRQHRTEVLITLHTDGIAKKAGYFQWIDDADRKIRSQAIAMTRNCAHALDLGLNDLYGWWAEYVRDGRGGTEALEQKALDHYMSRLRATRFKFVKAFPVPYIDEDAPPTERTPVCFYLVFGTHHQRGLEVMNAQMVRAVAKFRDEEYSHTFWPMLLPQLERDRQLEQVEREILTRFREPFTEDAMKHELMQFTTILLPEPDYRRTLARLVKEHRVTALPAGRYVVKR